MRPPVLSPIERAYLVAARRAVLATTAPDGHARLVPICFVIDADADDRGRTVAWSPLDDKPKASADVRDLARVRDIVARPRVTLLIDTWSEDWTQLGWLRCLGMATLLEPGDLEPGDPEPGALEPGTHRRILEALRAKHPQYRDHALERRPMVRIVIEEATSWGDLSA